MLFLKFSLSLIALVGVTAVPSPRQTFSGTLQVRGTSGSSFFVSALNPLRGVDLGFDEHLTVSFDPSSSPFDLTITNEGYTGPFQVGAQGGVEGIGLDSFNRTEFANVPPIPPNSPPVPITTFAYAESAIWSFDAATNELKPQFINADGSTPNTVFSLDLRSNRLFFIGDLALYNTHSGNNASPAGLFLLP